MIFIPVLKTKKYSEKNALLETKPLWEHNNSIIPYIQFIRGIKDSSVKKYIEILGDKAFFSELKQDENDQYESFVAENEKAIMVFNSSDDTTFLNTAITNCQNNKRPVALKVRSGHTQAFDTIELLSENDYLIINIEGDDIEAIEYYVNSLKEHNKKPKIIILSNERFNKLAGRQMRHCGFNDASNFNLSVINAIKNGNFVYDGFASFCSAKNDLTEEANKLRSKNIYGVLILYDYGNNNFYSIKSSEGGNIGSVYYNVKKQILEQIKSLENDLLKDTPLTLDYLKRNLNDSKFSSQRCIAISITRYIEEISNNLFSKDN